MSKFINKNSIKDILIISLSNVFLTFLVWFPHIFQINNIYNLDFSTGFNTIYRNYDGLNYVVIAKTFYFPDLISALPQSLPVNYFAAHFPGYPLLILLFAPVVGFLKSMILVSVIFTVLSVNAFYFLVRDFKLTSSPLILSLVFLVIPARWLVVHSVGSPEPVFIFFTILSLYFFMKYEEIKKWNYIWLAGIFGLFAQLVRPPGILLFFALSLLILWRICINRNNTLVRRFVVSVKEYFPLLLIPFGLVCIFSWFAVAYGDFWAYFKSGDNIHLSFPPYQVFNVNQYWVGSIWLEDIIYIFILALYGTLLLFKQRLYPLGFFVAVYFTATIFVGHRDISRYILPIIPFVLIAYEKVLVSREFKIVTAIIVLAIYLYAQNFILYNTAPIPNLELFD